MSWVDPQSSHQNQVAWAVHLWLRWGPKRWGPISLKTKRGFSLHKTLWLAGLSKWHDKNLSPSPPGSPFLVAKGCTDTGLMGVNHRGLQKPAAHAKLPGKGTCQHFLTQYLLEHTRLVCFLPWVPAGGPTHLELHLLVPWPLVDTCFCKG